MQHPDRVVLEGHEPRFLEPGEQRRCDPGPELGGERERFERRVTLLV
jgi:hypothetical protein